MSTNVAHANVPPALGPNDFTRADKLSRMTETNFRRWAVLPTFILAAAIAISGCSANTGEEPPAASAQSGAPVTDAPPTTQPPVPQPPPVPASEFPPPPVTYPDDGTPDPFRSGTNPEKITLEQGTYSVPKDLKPGRYTIKPKDGKSGRVTITLQGSRHPIDERLGDPGVPSVTTNIAEGSTVVIQSVAATFTPAKTTLNTSLETGYWTVGMDIAPGKYTVTPAKGESGTVEIYSDEGFVVQSEILGGPDGLADFETTLKKGMSIRITELSKAKFTAKS